MTAPLTFEAFMRNYQNMVYSTALRILANESEAQDIAQEVFLKAYERYEELSLSPTAGGWLKTVATNLSLNHLSRYRSRWRFFSEMRSHDEDQSNFEDDIPEPATQEHTAELADDRTMIDKALSELPECQRVPLVLYHFENMPYEEIATKLKISLSKVKTDIFRGRDALRRKLKLRMEMDAPAEPAPPTRFTTTCFAATH